MLTLIIAAVLALVLLSTLALLVRERHRAAFLADELEQAEERLARTHTDLTHARETTMRVAQRIEDRSATAIRGLLEGRAS